MEIRQYQTPAGREPVREFLAELPDGAKNEIFTLLRRLEAGETLEMPHCRSLSSLAHGLYELRVRDAAGQIRLFYYTKLRGIIYLLHALRKTTRIISKQERKLILRRLRYIERSFR